MAGESAPVPCCVCLYNEHGETCPHTGHHHFCAEHDVMPSIRAHIDFVKQSARADMAAAMAEAEAAIAAGDAPQVPAAALRQVGRIRASMSVRHQDGTVS